MIYRLLDIPGCRNSFANASTTPKSCKVTWLVSIWWRFRNEKISATCACNRDCARDKSLSATTNRNGQIARSAVTSRSEIPFTVTNRSPSRDRATPFPAAQPPTASPNATTRTRTNHWSFTIPPVRHDSGEVFRAYHGSPADRQITPESDKRSRDRHVYVLENDRQLSDRRSNHAARVLRVTRGLRSRAGAGLCPSLDLRRTGAGFHGTWFVPARRRRRRKPHRRS